MRALLLLLVAGGAAAQSYDFTRQDVKLDLTGASPEIELELTITATAAASAFDFLIPPAALQALDVDGASVTWAPHPKYPQYLYHVVLPSPLAAGATAKVHAKLGGAMRCQSASGPPACFTGAQTILLPANYEVAWYFVNLYEEKDAFDGEITVRAPAAHTVLAGIGAGTTTDLGDGTKQWKYPLTVPLDMLFVAAGELQSVSAENGGYTVKAYFPPSLTAATAHEQRAATLASQLLPVYARLFGDLPAREVHLITAPQTFPAAGMGMLGNVFMAEYIFGPLDYLLEQGTAHELAHSWWGNLASGSGDERGVLSEAAAEYSAWRALGEVQGDGVRTSGMRMNAVWYMYRTPAGQDVAPLSREVERAPGYVFVTYHKSPLVLRRMEEVAGAERFTAALKTMVASRDLSFAQLEAALPELKAETDQWLRQPGFPKLKVAPSVNGSRVSWALQSEGLFTYALPLRIRLAGGTVLQRTIMVKPGASEAAFDVEGNLETIEADPRWTLPREVKPAVAADVTFDGVVDGRDLLEVAVRVGGALPEQRRVDGKYDPLFDVDGDFKIDVLDMTAVVSAVR